MLAIPIFTNFILALSNKGYARSWLNHNRFFQPQLSYPLSKNLYDLLERAKIKFIRIFKKIDDTNAENNFLLKLCIGVRIIILSW